MSKLLRYTGKDLQDLSMEAWLKGKADFLHPLVKEWYEQILRSGEDVQGIFHDGYPMGCINNAPFAYINAFSAHVNVGFFYGAELPDPHDLLTGSGKRMRHVKLVPGAICNHEAILNLIQAAYRDIKHRLSAEQA